MKILVTGSNGFAGSHLLDHLLTNSNNKIYGLVKVNARMRNVKHLVSKVDFVEGDLTDPVSINNLIKLVPTNPAPPVITIIFFFNIYVIYLLKINISI